jgi:hypothetical protein
VRSAIYLPRGDDTAPPALVELLENLPLSSLVHLLISVGQVDPSLMRNVHGQLLQPYTDAQIKRAVEIVSSDTTTTAPREEIVFGDDPETAFRRAEFRALRAPRSDEQLTIEEEPISTYDSFVGKYFSRVMLVSRLRETRALAGFTRVYSENDQTREQRRSLLWRAMPEDGKSWLPAYIVYGEGIFLEFDEAKLQQWEQRSDVQQRIRPLIKRYQIIQQNRHLKDQPIGPRFLLMHTLAHLLMNRLTFECGYSSAALRERLYVSEKPQAPMAGILIYTAAGDAEGTLGGLVRMGKPRNLEPILRRAIDGAKWCSADPVCMEISSHGQGPDSCNLAACHNCALVPETACEEFNRFLDRAIVVGEPKDNRVGFFAALS